MVSNKTLWKSAFLHFPKFFIKKSAGMIAVGKKVDVIFFCSTNFRMKCSFLAKCFVFPWFFECLLWATQAWLSTNSCRGLLDIIPKSLSMPSRWNPSFTVSTATLCSASAVETDTQCWSLLDQLSTPELSLNLKECREVCYCLYFQPSPYRSSEQDSLPYTFYIIQVFF